MTTTSTTVNVTFCCACENAADPRYFTAGEHLCTDHWTEFYGTPDYVDSVTGKRYMRGAL